MKKVLSIFLSSIMLLSIATCIDFSSYAETYEIVSYEEFDIYKNLIDDMISTIPDTIYLDVKESEIDKAEEILRKNIYDIWINAGINMDSIDKLDIYIYIRTLLYTYISHHGDVQLDFMYYDDSGDIYSYCKNKEFYLTYSNSNEYNEEDERYIKNLKISIPKYYEIELGTYGEKQQFEEISKYYTMQIGDPTITFRADSGAGGGADINILGLSTQIGIYKNDVLYDIRSIGFPETVPVLKVPYSLSDSQFDEYVINKLNHSYEAYGVNVTSISKGAKIGNIDIVDGYKMYWKEIDNTYSRTSNIIVRRETEHEYNPIVTLPTCITQGYTTYTCTICGTSYITDYVKSTGHNFSVDNQYCLNGCDTINLNYVEPTVPPESTSPTVSTKPNTTQPSETTTEVLVTEPTTPPVQNNTAPQTFVTTTTAPVTPITPTTPALTTSAPTTKKAKPAGAKKVDGVWVNKKYKKPTISKVAKAKKSFKAAWKKVSGVNGYQIQYATDKKFKKNKKTVTVKGNKSKKPSKTIKKLKSKKTYYVRIRTYKTVKVNGKATKVYSSWSKAKSVKTK